MWLKKVFLIFATLFYCFLLVGGCHEGERAALMSFKSLLTDPSNRLSSWKGENCCNWKGIKCSSSGHVVVVNLRNPHPDEVMINVNKEVVSSSNNASDFALKGNISPLLFTLDHIQHIDLSFNNFIFSKLPVEISNLTKLTYLNLSNSMFQDSIDMQFSNLTSLRSLDLSCANLVPDLSSITVSLTLPPKLDSGVDLSKFSESFHWVKTISSLSNLISLQLSNCNISGRIPTAQLLNLTSLSTLEMSSNVLTSSIPDILSNLSTLSVLDFSGNDLDGHIPYLPQLEKLSVSTNPAMTIDLVTMFSVPWSKLTYLDISFTRVGRTVPPSLSNSTSLTVFLADGCSIEGSIPPSITKLKKLRIMMLNDNDITGQLPKNNLNGDTPLSLFRKSRLDQISFGVSGLSVEIDDQDQSLVQTFQPEILEFTSCNMRGEIPKFFSNLTSLVILILANNSLSGAIPYWLFNLPALSIGEVHGIRSISLSGNKIHGPIPESLCQAANVLQVLDLSNNSMSGTIRRNLANCKSLIYLNLGQNKLTGTVPKELERVTSLHYLDLNGNEFEGSFPTAIEKFQDLEMLNLAGNRFEGRIPKFIGDLHNITSVSLNNLSSPLPENLDGLKMMTKTQNQTTIFGYFYSLKFTGAQLEIVTKRQTQFLVSVYSYNTGFDASSNALTGKIPEKIGLLNGIPFLNLSHNNLFGLIPKTIGEMISLESLDLSYNHFTGEIPVTLTHLNFLAYLNLSYNNLSGQIPTNPQFDTLYQDGTAYVGNKYLCGTPDGMNCSNNYRPSTNEATENRYDQENVLFVLVIFSGFVTGISGVFLLLYLIDDNWRNSVSDTKLTFVPQAGLTHRPSSSPKYMHHEVKLHAHA
ncbi:hypothetical protein CQW23_13311 [Capsicum baccatum]|uniref:Leucine-rich repeat-containing N-terminal plant-type domain-containing protein n=1 Tax=Capsicum baccatum TaxID=33114 RepID=A0A2G2WV42_CAPBA|nr:hypothetical protein CQW23_13311 [Capsicum baccatum]